MMVQKVSQTQFNDLVGEVKFVPLNTPDHQFSGYYLPYVNNEPLIPVSDDYMVIKTQEVRNYIKDILENMGLKVEKEHTLNFKTYHKHVMILDKTFDFGEDPFENTLLEMDIPLNFDYLDDDLNNQKDMLGTAIEIYNSYCGLYRLFLVVKIIRFICVNGVYVGEKLDNIVIKHNMKEYNIEKMFEQQIPILINQVERLYMEYLPKFKKEISLGECINLLEKAEKLGVSKRYLKHVKEEVIKELEKRMNTVKLWWIWNFITYQIERSKSIANIATRQYHIYNSLMKEISNL